MIDPGMYLKPVIADNSVLPAYLEKLAYYIFINC